MERLLKIIKIIGIAFVAFFFCFYLLRIFGVLGLYRVPTSSMYPSIQPNSFVFTSKLIKPERGEVYCFRKKLFNEPKPIMYIHRIVAVEGDTCEIRNGYVFVNGVRQDDKLVLAWPYFKKYDNKFTVEILMNAIQNNNNYKGCTPYNESLYIINESEIVAKNEKLINAKREIDSLYAYSYKENLFHTIDNQNWTIGNYGPVTVPKGKYFMLGDNRYNAYDSRYTGFIDESEMKEGILFIVQ